MKLQPVPETIFLNSEISLTVIQFFLHRNQILHLGNGVTEKSCQGFCHICNAVQTCNNSFSTDAFQCIVKKVGIDLILQSQVLSLSFVQIHILGRTHNAVYHFHLLLDAWSQVQEFHIFFFGKNITIQKTIRHFFTAHVRAVNPQPEYNRKQNCKYCYNYGHPPGCFAFICQ